MLQKTGVKVLTWLLVLIGSSWALSSEGRNVCNQSRTVSYSQPYKTYTTCGFLGWERCGRTRYRRAYKVDVSYFCCANWESVDGVHCDKAICFGLPAGSCPNGGICRVPDVCSCPQGYSAPNCTEDNKSMVVRREYSSYCQPDGGWERTTVPGGEMFRFFDILIYLSFVKFPLFSCYWSTAGLYQGNPVFRALAKRRFPALLGFVQITPLLDIDKTKKLTRMKPLLDPKFPLPVTTVICVLPTLGLLTSHNLVSSVLYLVLIVMYSYV